MSSSAIPPVVTAETLCDYIEMLDGEQRTFRGVNNSALLIPIEAVGVVDITGLTAREEEAQRCPVGIAEHVDFGCQATATAA